MAGIAAETGAALAQPSVAVAGAGVGTLHGHVMGGVISDALGHPRISIRASTCGGDHTEAWCESQPMTVQQLAGLHGCMALTQRTIATSICIKARARVSGRASAMPRA